MYEVVAIKQTKENENKTGTADEKQQTLSRQHWPLRAATTPGAMTTTTTGPWCRDEVIE